MSLKPFLNLLYQKNFGPKYIKAGSCKQCGNCCRTITFKVKDDFIKDVDTFEKLKKWQKRYENFYVSGCDENGILLFTCKSLGDDNKCKSYFSRSLFCRAYPFVKTDFIAAGGKTIEGCGFYYKSSVDFDSLLQR